MKTVTFLEATHGDHLETFLNTRPTKRTSKCLSYSGQPLRDWVFQVYQAFHTMEEEDLVVCQGLHYAIVTQGGKYHDVNSLVSGLFALGCELITLNIDYSVPKSEPTLNDAEVNYWLELSDTELIPLNAFAVELVKPEMVGKNAD